MIISSVPRVKTKVPRRRFLLPQFWNEQNNRHLREITSFCFNLGRVQSKTNYSTSAIKTHR